MLLLDKKISFCFQIVMEHIRNMLLHVVLFIYLNIDSSLKLSLSIGKKTYS